MPFSRIKKLWNEFFFHPVPTDSLAVFRIIFSILLLLNALSMLPTLRVFYSSEGLLQLKSAQDLYGFTRLNVLNWLPDDLSSLYLLFTVHILAVIALIFGFFSRTAAAIALVSLASLHHRNTLLLNSADAIFRNILFLLVFAPIGAKYSLDAKFKGGAQDTYAPWVMRLIQVQFCVIYLSTFCYKLQGQTWFTGDAIYISTRLDDFLHYPLPWVLDQLWLMKLMTWTALFIEFALGALLWIKELRYPILILGIALHLGIEYIMNIPFFEFLMISLMILMTDPDDFKNFCLRFKRYLKKPV